jgi:hypothetical protein
MRTGAIPSRSRLKGMRWKLLKDYHSLSAESRAELEGLLAKVEPMKEIAHLICSHMEGILVWAQTRQTNGFLETLKSLRFMQPHVLTSPSTVCQLRLLHLHS